MKTPLRKFLFRLWLPLLWPLSQIYRLADDWNRHRTKPVDPRTRPGKELIISVGNITTGGTGKTPVVAWLARGLREAGQRPAIFSRGYGGELGPGESLSLNPRTLKEIAAALSGDEPWLLANRLAKWNIPVEVGTDRVGNIARLSRQEEANLFLVDDGFQHYRLARQVDIILLDATNPWGGNFLLPAGRLRNSPRRLKEADFIIITRCQTQSNGKLDTLEKKIGRFSQAPVFRARTRPVGLVAYTGGEPLTPKEFQERFALSTEGASLSRILLTAGIGNPEAFPISFRQWWEKKSTGGPKTILAPRKLWWRDHHRFGEADRDKITRLAGPGNPVVTTEKDYVKLSSLLRGHPRERDFHYLRIDTDITDGDKLLTAILEKIL